MQLTEPLTMPNLYCALLEHKGRERAVKSRDLERRFDCGGRAIRLLIPELEKKFGVVVLASYDPKDGGYYLPRDLEECDEGLRELHAHAISEITHFNKKKRSGEMMFGTEIQLKLELG